MSRELTKMNLIAIVQQLPEEDIHTIETYIRMIEQENKLLQEKFSIVSEMNVENYNKYCEALKEKVVLVDKINQLEIELEDKAYNELKIAYNKLQDRINNAIGQCESVIGNPEHTIVSKNELMKITLEMLKGDKNE